MEADRVRAELTPVFTDPAAKLEQLESLGLEAAVVSVSPALFAYETDEDRGAALCRAVNSGLAEFCTHEPSRLRWLAHVPLQAPDAAAELLAEAAARGRGGRADRHLGRGHAAGRRRPGPLLGGRRGARHGADAPPRLQQPPPRPGGLPPPERDRQPARDDHRGRAPDRDRHARPPPAACACCWCTRVATCPGRRAAYATRRRCAPSWPTRPPTRTRTSAASSSTRSPTTRPRCASSSSASGADNVAMGTDLPFDMATPEPVAALEQAVDADDGAPDHGGDAAPPVRAVADRAHEVRRFSHE